MAACQIGQLLECPLSTHLAQKRACPHGTSASPARGARSKLHINLQLMLAVMLCQLLMILHLSSASLSLSLLVVSLGIRSSVTEWLTARKTCRREQEPCAKHALIRISFSILTFLWQSDV